MNRFTHHFTIAEIGSLVAYRNSKSAKCPPLLGKLGIIKSISENSFPNQSLIVDFSASGIWKINAVNLAPMLLKMPSPIRGSTLSA